MNETRIPNKIIGISGILAPLIGFTFIVLALSQVTWFSWTENWLSDLGGEEGSTDIWTTHGTPSILFNIGLIMAGILGIIFALGLLDRWRSGRGKGGERLKIGAILLVLDATCLMFVGIFPLSLFEYHAVFAFTFFMLIPVSLLFIGTGLRLRGDDRSSGVLTLGIIGTLLFMVLGAPPPWGQNAILELLLAFVMFVFMIWVGLQLLGCCRK